MTHWVNTLIFLYYYDPEFRPRFPYPTMTPWFIPLFPYISETLFSLPYSYILLNPGFIPGSRLSTITCGSYPNIKLSGSSFHNLLSPRLHIFLHGYPWLFTQYTSILFAQRPPLKPAIGQMPKCVQDAARWIKRSSNFTTSSEPRRTLLT